MRWGEVDGTGRNKGGKGKSVKGHKVERETFVQMLAVTSKVNFRRDLRETTREICTLPS